MDKCHLCGGALAEGGSPYAPLWKCGQCGAAGNTHLWVISAEHARMAQDALDKLRAIEHEAKA